MIGQKEFELRGERVILRPLQRTDVDSLATIAFDPSLWQHHPQMIRSAKDLEGYIQTALDGRDAGTTIPFVTTLADSTVVGSTRFGNIEEENRRVEIGWTWVAKPWQRTFVNTEAKYLMLQHAFEVWNCVRVELKTGTKNERSRAAIKRLGAQEEGILRRHTKLHDGTFRDTVYYSILEDEWTNVKRRLEARLSLDQSKT